MTYCWHVNIQILLTCRWDLSQYGNIFHARDPVSDIRLQFIKIDGSFYFVRHKFNKAVSGIMFF